MVFPPASRFAWAFNDPAFADVLLVLRATAQEPGVAATKPHAGSYACARCLSSAPGGLSCDVSCRSSAATRDTQKCGASLISPGRSGIVPSTTTSGDCFACGVTYQEHEVHIHAHSIILASSSEMMRSWLSRWGELGLAGHGEEEADEQEQEEACVPQEQDVRLPQGWKQRDDYGRNRRRRRRLAMRLQLDLAPQELAAGEAVVRYMYTQSLDGVEDDEELLHCMLLADRWLLPDCSALCAARLQSTPAGSLPWRVRAALLGLPQGLAAASPHMAQLQARAEAAIMRSFRCPELMWEDPDNRNLLLSLHADRLAQLLLAREDVQVTSENVILALLSAWLEANLPPPPPPTPPPSESILSDHPSCGSDPQRPQAPPTAAAAGVAAPPEIEALVKLVRYGNLTPHYRTAVAPALPGLRGLRIHHELLQEANAAEAAAAEQAAAAAAAAEAEAAAVAAAAATAEAEAVENAVKAQAAAPSPCLHLSSSGSTAPLSVKGTDAATSPAGAPPPPPPLPSESEAGAEAEAEAVHKVQVKGEKVVRVERYGEASDGPGSTSTGSHVSCMAAAGDPGEELARPPTPPLGEAATTAAAAGAAVLPAGGAAAAGGGVVPPPARRAEPGAVLPPPAPAAAPRLPPRLPYNLFRRLEWCRDIRDVRIHLTGVGGPSLGSDAVTVYQMGPPVFLGGYHWQLATRFISNTANSNNNSNTSVAAAAAATAFNASTVTNGVSAATGILTGTAVPGGGAAVGPLFSQLGSAGRLQLQLGLVCTAPSADAAGIFGRPSVATGAQKPLSLASCTLTVLDASGKTAWQAAQAPCVLAPAGAAAAAAAAAESQRPVVLSRSGSYVWPGGTAGGAAASAPPPNPGVAGAASGFGAGASGGLQRWEVWSGLHGLEPSWWETGSALTTGGVLRLCCTLAL